MPAPTIFDRDGNCVLGCARGTKQGDAIVGWAKATSRSGREVNVPKHDCHNPRTGLPSPERIPGPSTSANASGTGTPAGSTPGKLRASGFVQISAWVRAEDAGDLLKKIAEIHAKEN